MSGPPIVSVVRWCDDAETFIRDRSGDPWWARMGLTQIRTHDP